MADFSARARSYSRSGQEQEGPETQEENAALPTQDFDNALRLAHHAQRLKAIEIGLENFSDAFAAFKGDQRRLLRRQTVISVAVGGLCLLATLATGIVIGSARHGQQPAPVVTANAAPLSTPAPAPTMPPSMPMAQPVQPIAPAPTINTAQPLAEEPALEIPQPAPVALGRYNEAPRVAAAPKPPARKISPLENSVALRLAATSQTVPSGWGDFFQREASGDQRAKLQIAAKFLKGEDVRADPAFALMLIRQAATGGNKEAMMWLAYSYEAGNLGKPDPATAAHWFSEAAKNGITGAYAELGRLYEKGVDGAPDPEAALAWYQRAASAGDTKSAEAVQRINRSLLSQNVLLNAAPPRQPPMLQPARQAESRAPVARPVAASIPQPPPAPVTIEGDSAERSADIRAAQRMLKVLGYKITEADGALGPQTQGAIRSYQRDHAAYPDGQFTPELLDGLTREIRFGQ